MTLGSLFRSCEAVVGRRRWRYILGCCADIAVLIAVLTFANCHDENEQTQSGVHLETRRWFDPDEFPFNPAGKIRPVLSLTALHPAFFTTWSIPNESFGRFTAQLTVLYGPTTALKSGESAAFLLLRRDDQLMKVGARYDKSIKGFRAFAAPGFSEPDYAPPVAFPSTKQLDLRVEQSDTQLIFLARGIPESGGSAQWTTLHTIDVPVPETPYELSLGMEKVNKDGVFFFTKFCWDGEEMGGHTEYPIIARVRDALDGVRAAQAKIRAESPDLPGATADLDAAITAQNDAILNLQAAIDAGTLQTNTLGSRALEKLKLRNKTLADARTAVASGKITKAKEQLKPLNTVAGDQLSAAGALFGWKVPNLKVAPQILSLHCPPA